jgi:hypothetical protein
MTICRTLAALADTDAGLRKLVVGTEPGRLLKLGDQLAGDLLTVCEVTPQG